MENKLNPFTYEVLRNRLWKINEEINANVVNTTPSHIVFESKDFNSAIMNAEGDSLVIGPYFNMFASVISAVVKCVLGDLKENPGIMDGDMFLTNDSYSGVCHSNDAAMVAPIFWDGEIICWIGVTIHEEDVGGPVPGSFCPWAKDMYEEAPHFLPMKIVEGGTLRKDLLAAWKFNSRLPWCLDGNVRARIAGISAGKKRIYETVETYGVEALKLTFERMEDDTETLFRKRLRDLPDGTWRTVSYIEQSAEFYPIKVAMSKKEDRLIWDFTGTAGGTDTAYNISIHGTRGGVEMSVLPYLCWDIPWTLAGLWRCMEVITEPGSLVHALPPMATNMAIITICDFPNILALPLSQMLNCSEKYKDRANAAWCMLGHGTMWEGKDQYGEQNTVALAFQCEGGGGGAWSCRDGEPTGGYLASSTCMVSNLEMLELHSPVLHLFWKESPDGGGPGKYRGGPGPESAFCLYDVDVVRDVGFMAGTNVPVGYGVAGGYPGGTHRDIIIRDFKPAELLKSGTAVGSLKELLKEKERLGLSLEVCPTAYEGTLTPNDLKIVFGSGGSGYGDPLDRDPAAVLKDVIDGLVTIKCAQELYGVEIDSETIEIDMEMTEYRRKEIKKERLK